MGLLTIMFPNTLQENQIAQVKDYLAPVAESLNLQTIVLTEGAEARVQYDLSPLIEAIQLQVQAINRLADSNRDLVLAMAEDGGMDSDEPAQGYLNAR